MRSIHFLMEDGDKEYLVTNIMQNEMEYSVSKELYCLYRDVDITLYVLAKHKCSKRIKKYSKRKVISVIKKKNPKQYFNTTWDSSILL